MTKRFYGEVSYAGIFNQGRNQRTYQRRGNKAARSGAAVLRCRRGKIGVVIFRFWRYAVAEFPDNVSAAAGSLAANAAGVAHVKATALITLEEMDRAAQKSEGLRPPGA